MLYWALYRALTCSLSGAQVSVWTLCTGVNFTPSLGVRLHSSGGLKTVVWLLQQHGQQVLWVSDGLVLRTASPTCPSCCPTATSLLMAPAQAELVQVWLLELEKNDTSSSNVDVFSVSVLLYPRTQTSHSFIDSSPRPGSGSPIL